MQEDPGDQLKQVAAFRKPANGSAKAAGSLDDFSGRVNYMSDKCQGRESELLAIMRAMHPSKSRTQSHRPTMQLPLCPTLKIASPSTGSSCSGSSPKNPKQHKRQRSGAGNSGNYKNVSSRPTQRIPRRRRDFSSLSALSRAEPRVPKGHLTRSPKCSPGFSPWLTQAQAPLRGNFQLLLNSSTESWCPTNPPIGVFAPESIT